MNKDFDARKQEVDKYTRIINEMLGDDYAKHAKIKQKWNRGDSYYLTVSFGESPIEAFDLETKQFHPNFIKLLEKIERERIFLTKAVPITFSNSEAIRKLDVFDLAKLVYESGITGRIETSIYTEEEEKTLTNEPFYNFYPFKRPKIN